MSNNTNRSNLEQYLEALLGFDEVSDLLDHLLLLLRSDAQLYLSDLLGSSSKNNDGQFELFLDQMYNYQSGLDVPPLRVHNHDAYSIISTMQSQNTNRQLNNNNNNNSGAEPMQAKETRQDKKNPATLSKSVAAAANQENKSQSKKEANQDKNYNTKSSKTLTSAATNRETLPQAKIRGKDKKQGKTTVHATRTSHASIDNSKEVNATVTKTVPSEPRHDVKLVISPSLQGRECGCYGTIHECSTNCLGCGRIACVEEGYGNCFFCGESLVDRPTTGIVRNEGIEHEQREWLRRDREMEQRTIVLDDQSDYYGVSGSAWVPNDERLKAKAADDKRRKEMHEKKSFEMNLNFEI